MQSIKCSQEARLKRKAQEDEAKKAKKQRVTYDPDKVNTPEYQQQRIRESLRASRSANVSRHVFPPPSEPQISTQPPPSEPQNTFTIPNPPPPFLSTPVLNPTSLNIHPPTPSDMPSSSTPIIEIPSSPTPITDIPSSSIIPTDIPYSSNTAPPPSLSHPLTTRKSNPYRLL